MDGQDFKLFRWLRPVAWLYGAGVRLRNKLFDWGWLRSESFGLPVICVGNLAVGGTGKTPHTEYLVRLLRSQRLNVATLSRGYRRKTTGYVLADVQSSATSIGDEPRQMKTKFPEVRVAVDEDRCHGIRELMKLDRPQVDVVLLDDAFQHRRVKAGLNILLTDCRRLLTDDDLLPVGRLREPAEGKARAQVVVVTKCPEDIKPIDFNIITKKLDLYPWQQLFFTGLRYGRLQPVFPGRAKPAGRQDIPDKDRHVLLVTGIAQPAPLVEEMEARAAGVVHLAFGDHHEFCRRDFQRMEECFDSMQGKPCLVVTTEKDAARLKGHPLLPDRLKPYLYVLPVEIKILQNQQLAFNQTIIDYVRKNPRNRILPQGEDAHPA